jgi:hypothetical protein
MKIYKIKLFKLQADDTYTWPNNPADPASDQGYVWNGTGAPIERGYNENMYNLEEGYYKLVIVAGTYPWNAYTESPPLTIGGAILNERLISYDCGEILILEGIERQYYFNVAAGKEKDTPNGFVTLYIQFTGISEGTSYHPAMFEEIALPPVNKRRTALGGSSTGTVAATTAYTNFPGAWSSLQGGLYVPQAARVLMYTKILNYNTPMAGPLFIPPGPYYGRYGDSYSSGRARGSDTSHWREMDLRTYGNKTITISLDPTAGLTWMEGTAF